MEVFWEVNSDQGGLPKWYDTWRRILDPIVYLADGREQFRSWALNRANASVFNATLTTLKEVSLKVNCRIFAGRLQDPFWSVVLRNESLLAATPHIAADLCAKAKVWI